MNAFISCIFLDLRTPPLTLREVVPNLNFYRM